jgi:hypothetical protein
MVKWNTGEIPGHGLVKPQTIGAVSVLRSWLVVKTGHWDVRTPEKAGLWTLKLKRAFGIA